MNIFKNKKILSIVSIALIIFGIFIYFLPLSFTFVNEQNRIIISHTVFEIKDGKPDIHSEIYSNITTDKKREIVSLFQKFNYRRKWNTVFSNGHLPVLGSDLINLSLYDGDTYLDTIAIERGGGISVEGKVYKIRNSEELISRLLEILNKSD